MVNTKKVKDRRKLRFENFAEVVRDAEMLADAERGGTLRATGNWTLGQAIGHVATWARFPLDGYPLMPKPPWFVRMMIPFMANSFLTKGLPAGINIGKVDGGTYGTDPMETDHAIRELRRALGRLGQQAPTFPNPILGELTHEEWIMLNLRHAELHFSFFHPE